MDPFGNLAIRFHYGGEFLTVGGHLQYFGGTTGMAHIELDKISLPEIEGHLADFRSVESGVQMHWLFPRLDMDEGLRLLHDDNACCKMAEHITDGGVADIYVEGVVLEVEALEVDFDKVSTPETISPILAAATDKGKSKAAVEEGGISMDEDGTNSSSSDESDADYQPQDMNSSGDDEETEQLRQFAMQIRMEIRGKKVDLGAEHEDLEDGDSDYLNSSDDYSYGEDSDGETVRWKSTENKYDSKTHVPVFALGMAFRSSRQFKKALIKYGLITHRHLLFPKDEKNKVRAVCSWKGCKWLIYGSKTSRSEWFKVVTFVNEHCCPPRRDNKLVTSRRIADKYKD